MSLLQFWPLMPSFHSRGSISSQCMKDHCSIYSDLLFCMVLRTSTACKKIPHSQKVLADLMQLLKLEYQVWQVTRMLIDDIHSIHWINFQLAAGELWTSGVSSVSPSAEAMHNINHRSEQVEACWILKFINDKWAYLLFLKIFTLFSLWTSMLGLKPLKINDIPRHFVEIILPLEIHNDLVNKVY